MTRMKILLQDPQSYDVIYDHLKEFLSQPDTLEIKGIMAYARGAASYQLQKALEHAGSKIDLFIGARNGITSKQAIEKLISKGCTVRLFDTGDDNILFHPKAWIRIGKHESACLLGSANFTRSGLNNNFEANILITGSNTDKEFMKEIGKISKYHSDLLTIYKNNWIQILATEDIEFFVENGWLKDENKHSPIKQQKNEPINTTKEFQAQPVKLRETVRMGETDFSPKESLSVRYLSSTTVSGTQKQRLSTYTMLAKALQDKETSYGEKWIIYKILNFFNKKNKVEKNLDHLLLECYTYAARCGLRPENKHIRHLWEDITQEIFLGILTNIANSDTITNPSKFDKKIRGYSEMSTIKKLVHSISPVILPRSKKLIEIYNHIGRNNWWWDESTDQLDGFPKTEEIFEDKLFYDPDRIKRVIQPFQWDSATIDNQTTKNTTYEIKSIDGEISTPSTETILINRCDSIQKIYTIIKILGYPKPNRFGLVITRLICEDDNQPSMPRLGEILDMSAERIRQIELEVLSGLRTFFDDEGEILKYPQLIEKAKKWKSDNNKLFDFLEKDNKEEINNFMRKYSKFTL